MRRCDARWDLVAIHCAWDCLACWCRVRIGCDGEATASDESATCSSWSAGGGDGRRRTSFLDILRILYIGSGGLSNCISLSCNSHTSLPCGPKKLHDAPSLRLDSRDPQSRVMARICGGRLESASVCVAQHRPTQLQAPITLIGHSFVTCRTGRAAFYARHGQ